MKRFGCCLALIIAAEPLHANVDPASFPALAFQQHPGAQLPLDTKFLDEYGRQTSLRQVAGGKPALVVLDYLRCGNLCSLVLSGAVTSLARAGLTPGHEVSLIAVSIDPRDDPAQSLVAKQRYARAFADPSASRGIHFLSGAPAETRQIASRIGFPYRFDQRSNQFAHPAGFVVMTGSGRVSRYMLGLNPPAATMKEAVSEAARGEVRPPTHPLLLLCFGYDPQAGSVAALVMKLVRICSLATLGAFALLLCFLWRRRRTA